MFQFFRDLFVVIVLMSMLGGCKKAPSVAEEADVKTLTFWHIMNYSGPKEVLEGAVKRFEAAHPGVKVIVQTFENDAYKVKLANEMASGNSPDVFFTWGAGGQTSEYIRQGKVLCLNEYAKSNDWEGRFIDSAMSICRNGGDLYSVPLDLSAVTLWCNKKLFEANGLAYPKTFEELLAVSAAFRAKKVTPLALGNMKKWPGAFYFCYLANRCGGTQLFLDAAAGKDSAAFDDVAFVTAGKMLRQLIDANAFSVGFNALEDDVARTAFINGKAAMYLTGSWIVARVKEENPDFMADMIPVPFPSVVGGKGDLRTVLGGVNCGFAVSSACKEPKLAVELLEALTDAQVVGDWCKIGRIPAVKTTAEQNALLPAPTRLALELLDKVDTLQPYYDQFLPARLGVEHSNTTQNLFAGTMTPEEAAKKMAETASSLKGN